MTTPRAVALVLAGCVTTASCMTTTRRVIHVDEQVTHEVVERAPTTLRSNDLPDQRVFVELVEEPRHIGAVVPVVAGGALFLFALTAFFVLLPRGQTVE